MATIKQYVTSLWNAEKTISAKMGLDLRRASFELRCAVLTVDCVLAALVKTLTAAGVTTDAALQAQLDAIAGSAIPQQPASLPPPDEATGSVPDPDLGS